jgi:hypothetical protein
VKEREQEASGDEEEEARLKKTSINKYERKEEGRDGRRKKGGERERMKGKCKQAKDR